MINNNLYQVGLCLWDNKSRDFLNECYIVFEKIVQFCGTIISINWSKTWCRWRSQCYIYWVVFHGTQTYRVILWKVFECIEIEVFLFSIILQLNSLVELPIKLVDLFESIISFIRFISISLSARNVIFLRIVIKSLGRIWTVVDHYFSSDFLLSESFDHLPNLLNVLYASIKLINIIVICCRVKELIVSLK